MIRVSVIPWLFHPTHKKHSQVYPSPLPTLRLTGADQVWCIVTILRDCSQHKSSIMLYYITLHLLTKPPPLIQCLATCRLSSHLVAHHCHIPARPNCTNQRLPPNQLWRKGQRPSRQSESNGQDESAPIAALAEWKSQGGSQRPNRQRHLSSDLLPPRIWCAQSKCQSPRPAGRLGCGKAGLEGAW